MLVSKFNSTLLGRTTYSDSIDYDATTATAHSYSLTRVDVSFFSLSFVRVCSVYSVREDVASHLEHRLGLGIGIVTVCTYGMVMNYY